MFKKKKAFNYFAREANKKKTNHKRNKVGYANCIDAWNYISQNPDNYVASWRYVLTIPVDIEFFALGKIVTDIKAGKMLFFYL